MSIVSANRVAKSGSRNRAKFSKSVYQALREAGMSNREIATNLGVNESSVRRALGKPEGAAEQKYLVTVTRID